MLQRINFALAILLVLVAPRDASAWNSIGHMAIAKLAYDQLEPGQQVALFKLLKTHPHYKEFLAASRPAEIENEVEWVVLRSSVWPDWVRPRTKDTRGADVVRYHRPEEHYVTIPFIDPAAKEFFAGKSLVNENVPNIVTTLKHRANDIKLKTAADVDRAVAVCWLIHLVGDIHQPLHTCSYFSNAPAFVTGDLGGNKFAIKAEGRKWRLHTFWDDLLGEDADYADDSPMHQANLYREAVKMAAALRDLALPAADLDKLKANATFESWSRESHALARRAYETGDGARLLKAVAAPFNGAIPDEAEEVGKMYMQNARSIAERQAVLAGRRLAERLRASLRP